MPRRRDTSLSKPFDTLAQLLLYSSIQQPCPEVPDLEIQLGPSAHRAQDPLAEISAINGSAVRERRASVRRVDVQRREAAENRRLTAEPAEIGTGLRTERFTGSRELT